MNILNDFYYSVKNLNVNRQIWATDQMYVEGSSNHYFYVGRSNLLAIVNAINLGLAYPEGRREVARILDFGCGAGRVTRYLKAAFPLAEISVADLQRPAAMWCAETFGCRAIEGSVEKNYYDLAWLGSVFTHLPESDAANLISEMCECLRLGGILIFTSQGRFSIERLERYLNGAEDDRHYIRYNLETEAVKEVVSGYRGAGYGYVNYPQRNDYGVCCAEPRWYTSQILKNNDFTQILFQEKGADNHQDVHAFMRTAIMDERKGSLW